MLRILSDKKNRLAAVFGINVDLALTWGLWREAGAIRAWGSDLEPLMAPEKVI